MISKNQPAPQRQKVLTFVSPKVADILFYETIDAQRVGSVLPEYGTPHPDTAKWPNHKLVFAAPDEGSQFYRYYYAAERLEQEEHNWQVSYPYAGLTNCPRYTCIFVVPRADFTPTAKGTAHPLDLGGATPEENEKFVGAKLVFEQQIEVGFAEIESLYIAVQQVYDKVATIAEQESYNAETEFPYQGNVNFPRTTRKYVVLRAEVDTAVIPSAGLDLEGATLAFRRVDRFDGQPEDSLYVLVTVAHDRIPNLTVSGELAFLKGYGYRIERPFGTDDHHRITWRIPAVGSGYTPSTDYAACPIVGYTGLLLTDESIEASPTNAGTLDVVRIFDSLPGPELENEIREKFADVPEGFLVERRTERVRQPVRNNVAIEALDATSPAATGGAIVRSEIGPDGASTTVVTKGKDRLIYTFGTLKDVEYDEETGQVFDVTHEIVPASTATGSSLSGGGMFSTISKLNQYFSIRTSRPATTLNSRTYDDVVNWGWPAVLEGINFFAVEAKDGSLVRFGYDYNLKEAYSGPCRATITESWSATPASPPAPVVMLPRPISFDFPLTRNFDIPSCLHGQVTITETIGTTHPTLAFAVTTKVFPATNLTQWPSSIIGSVSQTPYRGGYKMRVVRVYQPA